MRSDRRRWIALAIGAILLLAAVRAQWMAGAALALSALGVAAVIALGVRRGRTRV